jgi:hypothetical protein
LICLCSINALSFAQDDAGEKVADRLRKLFVLSFSDNYKSAAKYIVYRGSDTTRVWKDVYNYSNNEEKEAVIDVCTRIKSHLIEGGEYELIEFKTEKESEGKWYIWEVEFKNGNVKRYFAFLKIKGKYALGDID